MLRGLLARVLLELLLAPIMLLLELKQLQIQFVDLRLLPTKNAIEFFATDAVTLRVGSSTPFRIVCLVIEKPVILVLERGSATMPAIASCRSHSHICAFVLAIFAAAEVDYDSDDDEHKKGRTGQDEPRACLVEEAFLAVAAVRLRNWCRIGTWVGTWVRAGVWAGVWTRRELQWIDNQCIYAHLANREGPESIASL